MAKDKESLIDEIKNRKEKMKRIINQIDRNIDTEKIGNVLQKIASIRNDLGIIKRQIDLEENRQKLEDDFHSADLNYQKAKKIAHKHEADSTLVMNERLNTFNKTYNSFMTKTVQDCRRAHIDSDYVPIINDMEYREASADVPRRLLYYFTLLKLSLQDSDVLFPRFLLIDTPETSGIDYENLIASFKCIEYISSNKDWKDFQIILSTGIDKYPTSFNKYVVGTLTDENKLLKRKSPSPKAIE